jgi:hypothetical protein
MEERSYKSALRVQSYLIITIRVVERRAGLEAVEAAGYGCTGGGWFAANLSVAWYGW